MCHNALKSQADHYYYLLFADIIRIDAFFITVGVFLPKSQTLGDYFHILLGVWGCWQVPE